jgi:hypothetical protein
MIPRPLAAAALLGALVAAGCGGGQPHPVPTTAPGRFSGSDGKGVGAFVDFVGFDQTKTEIEAAQARTGVTGAVGIVSLVNRTNDLRPIPALWARTPGGLVRLDRALRRLRRGEVVALPNPGPYIPVQGAMTVYVRFPGDVGDIRGVRMRLGAEPPVDLTAQPEPSP